MRPGISLTAMLIALLLPAAAAQGEYRVCTRPVPNDAPPQVRKEILRLRDASEVTRGYAAYELYKMGAQAKAAVPFLRHLLADDSPLRAINTFGKLNWTGPTCPGLLAAEALWAIRPDEIAEALRRDPETARLNATRATTGMVHDRRALPLLLLAAGDPAEPVRHAAVLALGRSSDPQALGAVREALGDASARIRARAVTALGKRKDTASLEAMVQILAGDKDPWPRGYAAWYLGEMNGAQAVTPLIRSLEDRSAYVRRYAASSLGVLADARAVEPLLRHVGDADAEVRREVGEALGRFDDPRVAAAAVGELAGGDAVARRRAVAAVGRYPDTYAPHLIRAMDDPDGGVRQAAAEALGRARAKGAAAAAALAAHLRSTDNRHFIRETTLLVALQRLGNAAAVAELEKILLAAPTQNRFGQTRDLAPRAARSLAEIGTPEAIASLEGGRSAASPAARREVQRLLKVRSYTRRRERPARQVAKDKPKPRRQPQPPRADRPAAVARAASPRAARSPSGRAASGAAPPSSPGGRGYRVTGIIGPAAIINGKAVRAGDTVGEAKVVKVSAYRVELEANGKRFTVAISAASRN